MNKLYLILTTSFLSFNSTYSLLSHHNQLQKDEEAQVFHILEQFLQPTKPLKISYLGSEHETLSASTIIVTQAIKKVLKQIDPIFTDQCLSKISLGNSKMIPGKAVKVSLFYRLDKQKSFYTGMDIYVKEHDSDEETQVFDVLEQFLQPTNPLKISYLGTKYETYSAKTKVVTQAVKKVLKKANPVFTDQCLSKISLGDTNMMPGKSVKVSLLYRLDKQKSFYTGMDIYVKEHDSSKTQKVINALKIFNSPATAVKVDHRYAGKYADEYGGYNQAGSAIRFKIQVRFKTLLPHLMVSPKSITFNHVQLKPGSLVSLIASYRGKSTAILVKLTG